MRYSNIYKNDTAAAPGISVSVYLQGCPHRCYKCFNPETWEFDGGKDFTPEVLEDIIKALTANGIQRKLSILGGEPLCQENLFLTYMIIQEVKKRLPNTEIYIWTGYLYEDLIKNKNPKLQHILDTIDCLIDGPYVDNLRDITLQMRGSSNQRIIYLKK